MRYAALESSIDDEDLIRALAEAVAKQRGYADFYHWHEKRQKELGLLEAFSEAGRRIGLQLSDPRLEEEDGDPPDAWAMFQGQRVAIEFTEFVDGTLIEAQRHSGHAQWRWWSEQDVEKKLQSIVADKDHTGFGDAVPYWLVIHCDEPALNADILSGYLQELRPIAARSVTRCFVLLSYDPSIESYPLFEVTMERAA